MDEVMLKKYLTDLQQGKKEWNEVEESHLLDAMMQQMGAVDYELRDEQIYQAFSHRILDNALTDETLVSLLTKALGDDFLFYEIGDRNTDHVFKRSYSAKLISLILRKDLERSFISRELLEKTQDELLLYLDLEQDLRGFVRDKGFAHSVANATDAIDELVQNPKLVVKHFPAIYQTLVNKALTTVEVYIAGEDEHLLKPIFTMLQIGLPIETVQESFEIIPEFLKKQQRKLEPAKYWILYANCNRFLKSFYYEARESEKWSALQQKAGHCLEKM